MAIEWPFDKIGGIEKLIISDKGIKLDEFEGIYRKSTIADG